MELKLTPLILFFIILLVLVVSAIYMNRLKPEGFIDFNAAAAASSNSGTTSVTVPLYSTNSPLNKLYDNIYIDKRNANLVTLDGPSSGTQSSDPKSLYSINILARNSNYNSIVSYTNSKATITNYDSNESKNTSVAESYQSSVVHTNPPSEYQIFYFAWNRDTYLHVMDLTKKTHILSYCMDSASTITTYDLSANGPTGTYPAMNIKTTVADASDNTTSTLTVYDPTHSVVQLHTNIFYDSLRGYVVCTKAGANGAVIINNVYDYAGNDLYNAAVNANNPLLTKPAASPTRISSLVASTTPFASAVFTSTVVNGDASNNVLILSNANKKIIAHISADVNNRPVITNYLKYNAQTLDTSVASATSASNGASSATSASSPTDDSGNNPSEPIDSDKVYDEYMKWYTYWNSVGQPGNKGFSDDYLLKTQIVPPVCPACNTVGGCQNCNAGGSAYSGGRGSTGAASTGTTGSGGSSGSGGSAASTGSGSGTGTVIAHADGKTETVAATTAKQLTTVDRGGALASTADPDTLGGSLTLGQLSFVAGLQDVGHVIGDTATNAVNKVGEGVGAIGQGIGSAGSGIYNTVNAAGQGVYSAGQGIGGAVENTGAYLGGALNNVGGAIGNVGSTAYEAGKYVGTGVGGAIHDVGSTAYDAGKYVGTGVASGIKKIGDEIDEHEDRYGNRMGSYRGSGYGGSGSNSNIMNNGNINGTGYKDNYYDPSRQAYNNSYRGATTNTPGQYTGTDIDQYSYYGALQSKGGNFMPLTSDFSKFGR